jgi:hypothetical protein
LKRAGILRLARDGQLDPDQYKTCIHRFEQDKGRFTLRDLTLDLCEAGPIPAVATPRSLDLTHIRTALWFHAQKAIHRFVTMDTSQEEAATELGLPV